MKHWKEYYAGEIARLEFDFNNELLAQIPGAGETQRLDWLESTQAELSKVRKGLLEAMLEPQFEEILHSAGWQKAQQEFRTLLRLEAALQGKNPEDALRNNATYSLIQG